MSLHCTTALLTLATPHFASLTQFYSQLLNLQPAVLRPNVYAEFHLPGLKLGIFHPKETPHSPLPTPHSPTSMSLCLEVENLEEAIAHLNQLGYPPPGVIITASHGREIYAYDPDGNWLILHQAQSPTIRNNVTDSLAAMVVQAKRQLTLQEFLALPPDENDLTYELVDGQLVPKMSPKKFHSSLTRAFLFLLSHWCNGRGEVYPELAITLAWRGRDWVPTPDLLYVSYERLPASWREDTACPVPPDLAIEIISPGQTFGQLAAKARAYLDAHVLRVWVVDSKARSITVFYPDAPPQTYMGDTPLTDDFFQGLEFTVERVFQQAGIPLDEQ